MSLRDLRPHQAAALDMMRQSIRAGRRRPMLQAPTGFGKTRLAAAIVEGALAKGNRVLFAVPALSLIDQTVESFYVDGIRDVGVIQADHPLTDWSKPVQVASVQTLQRRGLPDATVGVVDEAHRWFEFYGQWFGHGDWRDRVIIGLSATPWTKGLGKYYDDLLIAATTADLIEQGYLSPFRVFAPSHPDLSGVRTVAGDFHEGDLSEAMSPLVADVVETWLRRGENRSTLCFAVDRAHAKHLQAKFEAAGVSTGYVDAYTDAFERERIRQRFHSGDIRVVCNVGCLTTGIDWDVRCLILARPTRSEMLYTQIIGRGLRTAEGKENCLILDHSDTTLRLGFVTDIHHDRLDDGAGRQKQEAKPREALPKECPKCSYLKPPKVSVCPACGFKPERQSNVEHEDGDLIELEARGKARANQEAGWDEKRSFLAQLRGYAAERGYASGWASHAFKDKFGCWPANQIANTPPDDCGMVVRNWVKSRQIARAKAMGKQRGAA